MGEFPVQNGEDRKGESGKQPPKNTPIGGIGHIELRDDQKDPEDTKKSEKKCGDLDFFLEEKRFEECGENWKAGIGQEPDCDSRNLDRLKKRHPMHGKDESQQDEYRHVFFRKDPHVLLGKEKKKEESKAGKKYTPQDNDQRG